MGYDDYRKDAEVIFWELDELAKSGAAVEWEERLAKLSADTAQAIEWVERVARLKDSN